MTIDSVAALLFSPDKKKVLLIERRDVPVWVLPGGGVEKGEDPQVAVVREFLEETGLNVTVTRLVGHYTPINRLTKSTHLYECTFTGGTLSRSEETRNVSFFPLDQLPRLLPPPYSSWIQDGLLNLPPLTKSLDSITYFALFQYLFTHPILTIRFLLARFGYPINKR
ncbi:MAG: NUDIX domain-containing protein [Chlamydiia bacterium]|nr:NUDIX domain-containing protein [Chlamydiia bacterium]